MRAARRLLLVVAVCATPLAAQEGGDRPPYAGRPLVDVLQDLNRRGLRIVFSTDLVPATLRVSAEPAGSPREILDQVLQPHGLHALAGAQYTLIVARAPRRSPDPEPPTGPRVWRPAARRFTILTDRSALRARPRPNASIA